jgi:hypothetical protein
MGRQRRVNPCVTYLLANTQAVRERIHGSTTALLNRAVSETNL